MKKRIIPMVLCLLLLVIVIGVFGQKKPQNSEQMSENSSVTNIEQPSEEMFELSESETSEEEFMQSEEAVVPQDTVETKEIFETEEIPATEEYAEEQPLVDISESESSEKNRDVNAERIEDAIKDGHPRIVVSTAEAKRGDTVMITTNLVNNPGVLGMALTLFYEESALELISVQNGENFLDVLTMNHSKELNSGCVFLWDGEEILMEQIKDGAVLKLEFKVLEDAPAGKQPITIICNEDGTVDNNLQTIDIGVQNGYIKIM